MISSNKCRVAVIGGSGFYMFPEMKHVRQYSIKTKFGFPSNKIIIGEYAGERIAFLPRHGRRHIWPPHKIPYRANLSALKKIGATHIIGLCASGSLQRAIKPGDFVVLDQFVNLTWGRDDLFDSERSFIHLPMQEPYCTTLSKIIANQQRKVRFTIHPHGTVVVIQGPRFTTKAESRWFMSEGWDVVNMTQYPECYFAKEMNLCYAGVATITDYDNGLTKSKDGVQLYDKKTARVFKDNVFKAKQLTAVVVKQLASQKMIINKVAKIQSYYADEIRG